MDLTGASTVKPAFRSIVLSVLLGLGLYLMLLAILVLGQALGASKFIYVDF